MLKSRDVIHRGLASFLCMIHVTVSVIIPVLKKKALLFDSPSYKMKIEAFSLRMSFFICSKCFMSLLWSLNITSKNVNSESTKLAE